MPSSARGSAPVRRSRSVPAIRGDRGVPVDARGRVACTWRRTVGRTRVLGPGVAITTYVDRRVPIRAYVLTVVDPSQGARRSGSGCSTTGSPVSEQTTAMAKRLRGRRRERRFRPHVRRPVHPFALEASSCKPRTRSVCSSRSRPMARWASRSPVRDGCCHRGRHTGETWPIADWNVTAGRGLEMTAYTAAGAGLDQPRPFTCSARLSSSGSASPTTDGTSRSYTVDQSGCYSSSLSPGDGVVLSAGATTDEATFLRSLSPGESMQIACRASRGRRRDRRRSALVDHGQVALGPCIGSVCSRNLAS